MIRPPQKRRNLQAAFRDLGAAKGKVRASAARDMAAHIAADRTQIVAALRQALADDEPEVRAAAAESLADGRVEEAFDDLLALVDDPSEEAAQMAISALGEIADMRALPRVEAALSDASPGMRFQAVMAFPRISKDHRRSVEILIQATRDDDPLVVHIALRMAEELGSGDDGEVVDAAILNRATALLNDEEGLVQVAAAVILGRCGRLDGADILEGVAARSILTTEHGDEAAALELCGKLGLKEATRALLHRGFRGGFSLRGDPFAWQARVALAALRHPKGVAWVLRELAAWTLERRNLAAVAAGEAKVAEARPLLRGMADDPKRASPEIISEALAQLEESNDG